MKKLYIAFIAILILFSSNNIYAAGLCPDINIESRSSKPLVFATYLKEQLAPFYSKIPDLSPNEKRWLDKELKKGNIRVYRSTEYAIQQIRQNIGSIIGTATRIMRQKNDQSVEDWSRLAYYLIEVDIGEYISRILTSDTINFSDIPHELRSLNSPSDVSGLGRCIDAQKVELARHILICIIPNLKGT